MQQQFSTRSISIRDFEEWSDRGELVLAPKFQRRDVWNDKARSYLMDTILQGKPIPKLYMRQDVNLKTKRTRREIVDGQQRLRTVLSFLADGFKISRSHSDEYGGKLFSELDDQARIDIYKYEFVVDLLQDMEDSEVFNIFARLNTYSEKLTPQELRHARWFGDFRSCVYRMEEEFVKFFEDNKLFTSRAILRMYGAEFISDLVLAMHEGIREGNKSVRDKSYKNYDDAFPSRRTYETRFRRTMDLVGQLMEGRLPESEFGATRFFYALFCALYHMEYGLPHLTAPRKAFRNADHPKLRIVIEGVEDFIRETDDDTTMSADDRSFYDAYRVHWVHTENRRHMTAHLCKRFAKAL